MDSDTQDYDEKVESYLHSFGQLPDEGITPELEECAKEFMRLLDEYGYTVKDAVCLLDPISRLRLHVPASPVLVGRKNRSKRLKTYTNPHTGEVVQSKGGTLLILRLWRQQYGAEVVRSWRS